MFRTLLPLLMTFALFGSSPVRAEHWPGWRGPGGQGVSADTDLPLTWSTAENVAWSVELPGEGSSSPVVWGARILLTAALDRGDRRLVLCLDRDTGRTLWRREIEDDNPEATSALTGYAAPTPATDGERVIAFFGNAGVVCYDLGGKRLWRRSVGEFESELGIASSPVLDGERVYLLCDHDGSRFRSFDSFLVALDRETGEILWKTERPKLFRSWSTPLLWSSGEGAKQLIVSAQEEVRAYDPETGRQLWAVPGMTGWVTPSLATDGKRIFATSGRNGPIQAIRPARPDDSAPEVVWQHPTGGPYVCSPLFYRGRLYVHDEAGLLTCYDAESGQRLARRRLPGKYFASAVAGDGKIYLTNDAGTTWVVQADAECRVLAENSLDEEILASPAISGGRLFLRTRTRLYAIGAGPEAKTSAGAAATER